MSAPRRMACVLALGTAVLALETGTGAAQQDATQELVLPTSDEDLARGQRLFTSQCSRCHGVGGTGGEGPPLNRPVLRSAPDDMTLASVIAEGIPGSDMSGSWHLTERDVAQLAAYVRSIGSTALVVLPGDPGRGEVLFTEQSDCLDCHIVGGVGTGWGPELSDVGARRGAEHLLQAIVDPEAARPSAVNAMGNSGFSGFVPVRALLADGRVVSGMRINEDDFTIQLRTEAGGVRSIRKDQVTRLDREFDGSLMPSYDGVFTDGQLQDLVAYLASLRGGQ